MPKIKVKGQTVQTGECPTDKRMDTHTHTHTHTHMDCYAVDNNPYWPHTVDRCLHKSPSITHTCESNAVALSYCHNSFDRLITYKGRFWYWMIAAFKAQFAIFGIRDLLHTLNGFLRLARCHDSCAMLLDPLVPILKGTITIQHHISHKYTAITATH